MPDLRLTKRDLQVLTASVGDNYDVTVRQTEEGFWTIHVTFNRNEQTYSMETTRGAVKAWRDLCHVIQFVQNHCKAARHVFVEVGDWKLTRLSDNFRVALISTPS